MSDLTEYAGKRDFTRTPEPSPDDALRFVIQKHAARNLHYDLRLEVGGTFRSWAVPKGPSLDPEVRTLAVQVEDHPLAYGTFEGTIPKGEYGGGTVMLWDRGRWIPGRRSDDEVNPGEALKRGRLHFRLEGERLRGAWLLVRTEGKAGEDGKNWLLRKMEDADARPGDEAGVTEEHLTSVTTGRTMEGIAGGDPVAGVGTPTATAPLGPLRSPPSGAPESTLPRTLEPQLPTLVKDAPKGEGWIHELKFDGYRIQARIESDEVTLVTRGGHDWTDRFPGVAAALGALGVHETLLDGEIAVPASDGTTDFQALQNRLSRGRADNVTYFLHLVEIQFVVDQRVDGLCEPLHLGVVHVGLGLESHVGGASDLTVKPERLGAEDPGLGQDRHKVLLVPHHEGGDPRAPGALHHVGQEAVGLVRVPRGREEMGALEEQGRDGIGRDEPLQVDLARLSRRHRLELLVGDHHRVFVLEFVSPGDLVILYQPFVSRAVEPPSKGGAVLVQHLQRDAGASAGGEEPHRDADEPEADRAGPGKAPPPGLAMLDCLQARLEEFEELVRALLFLLRLGLDRPPFPLDLDELGHPFPVVVPVPLRLEVLFQRLHELLGHVEFPLRQFAAGGRLQLRRRGDLARVPERHQEEVALPGPQGADVALLSHDPPGDPLHPPGLEGAGKGIVGSVAAVGAQGVRLRVPLVVDEGGIYEPRHLDVAGRLGLECLPLLVREDDHPASLDLDPPLCLGELHRGLGMGVDHALLEGNQVVRMEEPEADVPVLHRREQLDGEPGVAEAQHRLPHGPDAHAPSSAASSFSVRHLAHSQSGQCGPSQFTQITSISST